MISTRGVLKEVYCNRTSFLRSSPIMNDFVSGLVAQKITELFALCGVENSEELFRSLTAHAVSHRERTPAYAELYLGH